MFHYLLHFSLNTIALFWIWETIRLVVMAWLPNVFNWTRWLHPFVVVGMGYLLCHGLVVAMAMSGIVIFLHLWGVRLGGVDDFTAIQRTGRRRLNRLP